MSVTTDRPSHHHPENAGGSYRAQTLPMYEVSERLKPLVEKYNLQQNLDDMRDQGWTVITGVPLDLTNRIRAKILEMGESVPKGEAEHGFHKLFRYVIEDPVFAEAATYPPLLVMAEYLLGPNCVLSETLATVKYAGGTHLGLHTDQPLIPTPYPEHMSFFTSCWVLDKWDEAHGSTIVVPDSHKLRRYPEAEETKNYKGHAIEAEAGSIVIWGGFTWHDSSPRSVEDGERVVMHIGYTRQCFMPNNDFRRLGKGFIASSPPAMAGLLGEGLPYGDYNDTPELNSSKLGTVIMASRS